MCIVTLTSLNAARAMHALKKKNRQRRAHALLCSCREEERENMVGAMGARTRYGAWSYSAAAARMAGDADPPGFAAYPRGGAAAWGKLQHGAQPALGNLFCIYSRPVHYNKSINFG
jgi:hypothetical protein